ncbi:MULTISPECIES: GlxA family transcriptional regulator [Streptomyces]|uniref:GlxA family transcriptional regulator n=1 Tax=Streptomyces TaxID=1883 RepID=UPI001E40766A|nr:MULTISPECIES: helix-turn-helix domain-containing protein [Streptomyces]UFQ16571.1 helix-turn-helix domain-containing protein [Streptomyces huasconensis]WCL86172.1 helix-turn-helix domain-containing protein [Streptomyces sp. JCM 35825]
MSVIAVLALDGVPGHQLTAPGLAFGTAARHHHPVAYEVRICAAPGFRGTGGPAPFGVDLTWGPEGLDDADTVLLPGHAGFRDAPPPEAVAALRAAVARGARVGAVGTGTFTLAATGLLDGRRAATSRRHTRELAALRPRVDIDPEGRVVADGPFHSAAGVLGGIDLCLHLITLDHGEAVAIETERQLFLQLHDRPEEHGDGTEPQGDGPEAAYNAITPPGSSLGPVTAWMEAHLHRPLTLTEIAAHAGLGVRALTRRFRADTGLTPLQYLLRLRVQRAQRLLERTDDPVERIATRTGLGTPANLRHHFQRSTGTSPTTYRAAFRALVSGVTWPERADRVGAFPGTGRGAEMGPGAVLGPGPGSGPRRHSSS